MANTYTLISSNVLGSSAASVTFSSIPSTYTDLVLRISSRQATANTTDEMVIKYNGIATTTYSSTTLNGQGSTTYLFRASNGTYFGDLGVSQGNSTTASTFGSIEIYIPNYTVAANIQSSGMSAIENNSATANWVGTTAGLWRNNGPVSSISMTAGSSSTFNSGSSFYLYGIKNS